MERGGEDRKHYLDTALHIENIFDVRSGGAQPTVQSRSSDSAGMHVDMQDHGY